MEKIGYTHHNPVLRGLAAEPSQWPLSSSRHFATGEIGVVEIEQWTATRREHSLISDENRCPTSRFSEMWAPPISATTIRCAEISFGRVRRAHSSLASVRSPLTT